MNKSLTIRIPNDELEILKQYAEQTNRTSSHSVYRKYFGSEYMEVPDMTFDKEGRNPPPPQTNGLGDRDLLILLLHEYSEKLINLSQRLFENRAIVAQKEFRIRVLYSLICISIFSSFYIFKDDIHNRFSHIKNNLSLIFVGIVFVGIIIFLSLRFTSLSYGLIHRGFYENLKIEVDILERNARLIANQLESAMRLAVGISDQAEVNVIKRLEWDLRLMDAFRALEYYYSITGSESKSNPQKSKSNSFKSKKNGIDPLDKGIFIPKKSGTE